MVKVIKSRKFLWFVSICLIGSMLLILFNLSQFKKYQVHKRNSERKAEVKEIVEGIEKHVIANNNLPTTSNPSEKSFLPELIMLDEKKPSGGVSIQTLENMNGDVDTNMKDPSGNPYLVGLYEDKIIVYTNNFELENGNTDVYYEAVQLSNNNVGNVKE